MRAQTFAVLTLALMAAPAQATIFFYAGASSETAFNNKVTELGLTFTPNPAANFSQHEPFTANPTLVNAVGTGLDILGLSSNNLPLNLAISGGSLGFELPTVNQFMKMTTAAPGNVVAVGFHFTWSSGMGFWCLDLQETATTSCAPQLVLFSPSTEFFGVISDGDPLTNSLIFGPSVGGSGARMLDFKMASVAGPSEPPPASTVPEPRSMFLIGTGLVGVSLLQRRRLRRQS